MFVVHVLYPNTPGSRFDEDYYQQTHMPLVRRLMEPLGLVSLGYYKPVEAMGKPPFQVIAELRFQDAKAAQTALGKHGAETSGDVPNFTDVQPQIVMGSFIAT